MFETQNQGRGMTPGQIQTINLFFEKYVPGIEGICTSCYKVSLPMAGSGEQWKFRSDERYEIRLSAAKPQGFPGQRREYVTQTSLNKSDNLKFAMWNSSTCAPEYTDLLKQEATHIPWEIYDFNQFSIDMPRCQCNRRS